MKKPNFPWENLLLSFAPKKTLIDKMFDVAELNMPAGILFYEKMKAKIMQYNTNSGVSETTAGAAQAELGCYQAIIKPSSSTYSFDVTM